MSAYTPHDPAALAAVATILAATLLAGLALGRRPPTGLARGCAWLVTIGATAAVERLCRHEPAGVRMLVLIGALLFGMKAVVTVEARLGGMAPLAAWRWLGFAALWPGMRPAPFARAGGPPQSGGWDLVGRGMRHVLEGLVLVALAWLAWHRGRGVLGDGAARLIATLLLLPGLSLILHFGIFNIVTGLWRRAGVDVRPLFRAPLAAPSLDAFWSRRWNLAFSEMTALGIYRPLAGPLGRRGARVAAFGASGLLHELAISVPVLAGFGRPMAYFALHGALLEVERRFERAGRPVSGWGPWKHVWVLGWVLGPVGILFHRPFLEGVVWPIIGLR
ncbi:MAG: MBOAT family protein [Ardenticatenales bacterium]